MMTMKEGAKQMEFLSKHGVEIITGISYLIAAASVFVKLTPTLKDDNVLGKVVKVFEFIALNKRD